MPRNREAEALQALDIDAANYNACAKSLKSLRAKLETSMVRAVKAGASRGEVAKRGGLDASTVGRIPGMPAGRNVAKSDDDGRRTRYAKD